MANESGRQHPNGPQPRTCRLNTGQGGTTRITTAHDPHVCIVPKGTAMPGAFVAGPHTAFLFEDENATSTLHRRGDWEASACGRGVHGGGTLWVVGCCPVRNAGDARGRLT